MAIEKKLDFEIDHYFDPARKRHYLNGVNSVLHCHHFATLYTQLAMDATDFNGVEHLVAAAEDSFFEVLDSYFRGKGIERVPDRLEVAQQYWQTVGMGLIRFTGVGPMEVAAEMEYSHLDEGWLKKWGGHDKPVNYFTAGFVAAVASLVNNKPVRSFRVSEVQSLVCGDEKSRFLAVTK
jgi:predicted hydrocarbon binding protein